MSDSTRENEDEVLRRFINDDEVSDNILYGSDYLRPLLVIMMERIEALELKLIDEGIGI